MKTRTNQISQRTANVDVCLGLQEAFALGTVLAAVEGEDGQGRQARAFGAGLLEVGRMVSPYQAEMFADQVARTADPRTKSGKLALVLAEGLLAGAERARDANPAPGYGQWVDVGATRESPVVAPSPALPSSTDANEGSK